MLEQKMNKERVAVDVSVAITVDVPYASLKRGVPAKNPSGTLKPDWIVNGIDLALSMVKEESMASLLNSADLQ